MPLQQPLRFLGVSFLPPVFYDFLGFVTPINAWLLSAAGRNAQLANLQRLLFLAYLHTKGQNEQNNASPNKTDDLCSQVHVLTPY
jgi:hypothetical protein